MQALSYPGEFINPTTVRVRSGHKITSIMRHDLSTGPYYTGWMGGTQYVSNDGHNWRPSELAFRCA